MSVVGPRIALITGSTRIPGVGKSVTSWVHNVIKTRPADQLEVRSIAISDYNLPVFDEPVVPALVPGTQQLTKEHSKKWSEAISSFQGYVFVIPEYNGSMSGATKNAIDYLYHELLGKPVAVISYGSQGGSRANTHLRESLELIIKMKVVPTNVLLPFAKADVYGALTQGRLTDETFNQWSESNKEGEILKAVQEIKEVLAQPKDQPKDQTKE